MIRQTISKFPGRCCLVYIVHSIPSPSSSSYPHPPCALFYDLSYHVSSYSLGTCETEGVCACPQPSSSLRTLQLWCFSLHMPVYSGSANLSANAPVTTAARSYLAKAAKHIRCPLLLDKERGVSEQKGEREREGMQMKSKSH